MVVQVPTGRSLAFAKSPLHPPSSFLLHEWAREYYWKGPGRLSIKAFFGGRAHYQVATGHHAVDAASYLVLNEGQSYSIQIESGQPVESFCLFFAPEFAADVCRTVSKRLSDLLDRPEADVTDTIRFFEKNYAHDDILSPALLRLRQKYRVHETGWLIEQFHGILERLLKVHRRVLTEVERLENVRPSTREELYRRVSRARDYAHALFAEPLTLADVAGAACLSPNHLLRTFRAVFGETPHQFLTRRRLDEAKYLLTRSDQSVTSVCLAVGFESPASFSTLFRARFGVSPSAYREQKGDFRKARPSGICDPEPKT